MSAKLPRVEYLIGYEGDAFGATGRAEADILSVAAAPLREESLRAILAEADAD